jgi:exopolyphosphatase/guanosine-5'-triphosphate,3'-diphosphate pyrophosphatase
MGQPRTVAAIDIGTNSIKLLVARVDPRDPEHYEEILREKEMVRLGQETLTAGRLSDEAIADGVDCLIRYAALARAAGAREITTVATCALREAENAAEFVEQVRKAAGLSVAVISGEEEARLVTRAVRRDLPLASDPLLVVDIGGGSTEIVVAKGKRILLARSLELGAVRLTDLFVKEDPLGVKARRRLVKEIRTRLSGVARPVRRRRFRTAVGTSGTIMSLAQVVDAQKRHGPAGTGHREVTRAEITAAARLMWETTLKQKLRVPGLDPERRDIITAGAILLEELMEAFGIESLLVSERSLRDGLLLEAAPGLKSVPVEAGKRNVRHHSVERLARRGFLQPDHARQTRELSLSLFDQTHVLHQLADREREWLEHASTLHDLGLAISYSRHHHHSYYLIVHGGLAGFTRDEVELIGLVARYHRKSAPKGSHQGFRRLDPWKKPVVVKLAALLRIADGLDRTHRGVVTSLRVEIRRKKVILTAQARGACDLELWAARKKAALFEKVFGRKLVLKSVRVMRPARARRTARPRVAHGGGFLALVAS